MRGGAAGGDPNPQRHSSSSARAISSKGGTVVDIPLVAGGAVSYAGRIDYGVSIYHIAHGRTPVAGLMNRASDDHPARLLGEPFLLTFLRPLREEAPRGAGGRGSAPRIG